MDGNVFCLRPYIFMCVSCPHDGVIRVWSGKDMSRSGGKFLLIDNCSTPSIDCGCQWLQFVASHWSTWPATELGRLLHHLADRSVRSSYPACSKKIHAPNIYTWIYTYVFIFTDICVQGGLLLVTCHFCIAYVYYCSTFVMTACLNIWLGNARTGRQADSECVSWSTSTSELLSK